MALKKEKVLVTSGKKKANVRRETSVVSGMRVTIVHNKKLKPKAATPSEPSMTRGRCVSRKRCIKGKSNHGAILRQPCRYYLKGTCTSSPCEYWHPPECQLYKLNRDAKQGTSVCSRIMRLTKNQTRSRQRESDDRNAVAIAKIGSQMGDSHQRGKQAGETRYRCRLVGKELKGKVKEALLPRELFSDISSWETVKSLLSFLDGRSLRS